MLLGRGRFGVVREAYDALRKEKVAVKVLNKSKDKISCQTEVMIYSTLLERLGEHSVWLSARVWFVA